MLDLKLNAVPDRHLSEYNSLMLSPWLSKKIERTKRIAEKVKYVNSFLPEIKKGGLSVLDIATGPGEFLEICRHYGNRIFGIDKFNTETEQYSEYSRYSQINHARQDIPVINDDFFCVLIGEDQVFDGIVFDIINCQHAINFIARACFDFRPEDGPYKNNGSWKINSTFEKFFSLYFSWCNKHLSPSGSILISALNATNKARYSDTLISIASECGFCLVSSDKFLVHKFRRNHV